MWNLPLEYDLSLEYNSLCVSLLMTFTNRCLWCECVCTFWFFVLCVLYTFLWTHAAYLVRNKKRHHIRAICIQSEYFMDKMCRMSNAFKNVFNENFSRYSIHMKQKRVNYVLWIEVFIFFKSQVSIDLFLNAKYKIFDL